MKLKTLVAAVCFMCIALSACTFKDIKNEQAYLDLQEEKIITVHDNIVYYNNDNDIKIMKHKGNDVIEEIFIDNAKGIYATDTCLYYLKENTIVCKNIKRQTIEKEYSDEKILNAIYKDGKIFYTTDKALKRIDLEDESVDYVLNNPCVITKDYITYIKEESIQSIRYIMGIAIPEETKVKYVVTSTYSDKIDVELSKEKILSYEFVNESCYFVSDFKTVKKVDLGDNHSIKTIFKAEGTAEIFAGFLDGVEGEYLNFRTVDGMTLYKYKVNLKDDVIEHIGTKEL